MSVSTLDYIPFDYRRYFQEILPAFEQAFQGNPTALQKLINSATNIARSLRTQYPVPFSGEERQDFLRDDVNMQGLLDAQTLRRVKAGGTWNPWEAFTTVLPTLEGRTFETLGTYGELLKSLLLATFCCDLPPWSGTWLSQKRGAVVWHDEVLFDWTEYTTWDEQTRQLWGMFHQPLPQEITRLWQKKEGRQAASMAESHPRALFSSLYGGIAGFITCEEIERLLPQVRTRAKPELNAMKSECIRDGEGLHWTVDIEDLPPGVVKSQEDCSAEEFSYRVASGKYLGQADLFAYWKRTHPAEIECFQQRYYQNLWMIEEEVLYRLRFAAARGWGMLKTY